MRSAIAGSILNLSGEELYRQDRAAIPEGSVSSDYFWAPWMRDVAPCGCDWWGLIARLNRNMESIFEAANPSIGVHSVSGRKELSPVWGYRRSKIGYEISQLPSGHIGGLRWIILLLLHRALHICRIFARMSRQLDTSGWFDTAADLSRNLIILNVVSYKVPRNNLRRQSPPESQTDPAYIVFFPIDWELSPQ